MLVLIPIVLFIIIFVKYPSNFSIIIHVDFIFVFMHNTGIIHIITCMCFYYVLFRCGSIEKKS